MTFWWKFGLIAALFFTGVVIGNRITVYYNGYQQTAALAAEIDQHKKDTVKANNNAANLEKALAGERQSERTLRQQLEAENAKIVDNCPVSANFIRLRNKAAK